MSDLLEGGIKISMLRAHLNISVKFAAQRPVIDRDHVPALQVCCDAVDPIKRGLVKVRPVNHRAVNENKLVAVEPNKSLTATTNQAHGHRVQEFVGKMNAHEWLQQIAPFNLIAK